MITTITTNSNTPVNGISPGREFSLAVSGTFDGATIRPQYATAAPVKAALTIDDNADADAIVLTATDGGTQGNDITIAVTVPATANATLSHTQTGRAFVLLTATDANAANTTTVAQALAYLGGPAFKPHFTAALAGGADEEELIKPISATNLAGGTNGTFANFADTATALTSAGEIIVTNPGVLPTINLNVASVGGSTSIVAVVKEIPL